MFLADKMAQVMLPAHAFGDAPLPGDLFRGSRIAGRVCINVQTPLADF
jgi:hypothetical protein